MSRLLCSVFLLVVAVNVSAAQVFTIKANDATGCDMQPADIPIKCDSDLDRGVGSSCTAEYVNRGTAACVGKIIGTLGAVTQGSSDQGSSSGPIATTCRSVGLTPMLSAEQSGIAALESAVQCEGTGTVPVGGKMTFLGRLTPGAYAVSPFRVVSAMSFTTTALTTNYVVVGSGTLALCNLVLSAPGVSQSAVPYSVSWSSTATPSTYQVQEATKPDFSDATTSTTSSLTQQYTHTATGSASVYYYRVRSTNCSQAYSLAAQVTITPAQDPTAKTFDLVVQQGSTTVVVQEVRFEGLTPNVPFTASVDQPYLTVVPATGTVGASGIVNLTVRANPTGLALGANTATVTITTASSKTAGRIVSLADNVRSVPVSVNVSSPVTTAPKTPPPASSVIVPAVAHRDGIGAQFLSDVRLANVNTTATSFYQLTYTASNSDGSKNGRQTRIDLGPGQMAALTDILRNVFGAGTSAADASGVLEIRMLGNPASGTVVASRTYSAATTGTYGQFVPSVTMDRLATAAVSVAATKPLILSHVGQTASSRLNVGLAESLGFATSGHIRAYGATGQLLVDVPYSLQPFEHQQINSFLARNGIIIDSARIEVVVDPPAPGTVAGGVAAYASQLDNTTHDGSVVTGVKAASVSAKRFILPGVSESSSSGDHSEVRILNAGTAAVNATLTFYPENGSGPIVRNATIAAGEIKSYDRVVTSLFGVSTGRGSLVVTTPDDSSLLVTARTYSGAAGGGTYGKFVTALTVADGIGSADGDAHLLQLEQSDRFRSDLSLAEITGSAAEVQISLIASDSKSFPSTRIPLAANQSMNIDSILTQMGATGNTYNARIALKITGGTGRIAAFGTLVDRTTNDPTTMPAQR